MMDKIFYNEDTILLNKSFRYLKYIIIIVLIILLFVLISTFIKFEIVSIYKGIVMDNYIKTYIKQKDISYIKKIKINNISEYKIQSVKFIPENNLYEIDINLNSNYKKNTIYNIKINKKKTTIFKEILEFITKSINYD